MGARTIRSGIGTYLNAAGQWTHGVLGDEVEVHEDDLERFDRLNPPEPEAEPEADAESEGDEAPSFSQDDIDAAVKAATDAQAAELEQLKADLAAAKAEADKKAPATAAPKAPAAKPGN